MFLLAFALTGRMAWSHKSATFDEPLHFVSAWIQTHYHDLRTNPEDPPLWKYYVAAGTRAGDMKMNLQMGQPETYFSDVLYRGHNGTDVDGLLAAGRARMILLGIVLGALIAWWAWRLAGPLAAMVAAAAFCLDPNFLAHAPLIKNDVPITLIFFALMAAIWLLGERATWMRWLLISLLTGAALTTKYSGVLAIPMLGIALLLRAISPQEWRVLYWTAATRRRRFAAAIGMGIGSLLIAYVMIWACYNFRFLPAANSQGDPGMTQVAGLWAEHQVIREHGSPMHVKTSDVDRWASEWQPDRFLRTVKWVHTHRLLPEVWLVGFVYTTATSMDRPTFLCGQMSRTGWWYYFPLAMAFKTPLATLVGLTLSLAMLIAVWSRQRLSSVRAITAQYYWPLCAAMVAPVMYLAVAMHSNLNLGIRHVLPIYPWLFLALGLAAAYGWRRRPRLTAWIIGILLVGLALETYSAYPDYIPFFNVAAGGSRGGLRLLGDSNIDWGQDLPALAEWQSHNQNRQLYLSYFGTADPKYYGIHYIKMSGAYNRSESNEAPVRLRPVFAISAVSLQGQYLTEQEQEIYRPFRGQKPLAVLGGSLYLFDLP